MALSSNDTDDCEVRRLSAYDLRTKLMLLRAFDTLQAWRRGRRDLAYGTLSDLCSELTGVGLATIEGFLRERRLLGHVRSPIHHQHPTSII
jgi:hypothetical protein